MGSTMVFDGNSQKVDRTANEIGRELLDDWNAAQPDNFFAYDVGFQRSLEYFWGKEKYRKNAPALFQVACLAIEGEWEHKQKADRTKLRLDSLIYDRRVAGRQPKDIPYYDDKVSRLCQ